MRKRVKVKRFLSIIFIMCLGLIAVNVLDAQSQPTYSCYKVKEPVHIDGRLDESFWENVPDMEFREIATGSDLPYPAKAKMVWDDQYLYVGFVMEEPHVWATSTKRGEQFYKQKQIFAKLFLDPDGDGIDYIEFHVNPHNNVYDLHLIHDKRIVPLKYHFDGRNYEWDCNGLKTAVYIDGTLNNSEDIDKYWSVEMAIPWSSLSPFTIGKCPPAPGDKWAAHLGRTYFLDPTKNEMKDKIYGTWPVIGEFQCHFLDKWGFVKFLDAQPKKPINKSKVDSLQWKMVWAWTLPFKTEKQIEEGVAKARSLGFNAMVWNQADSESFIRSCRKYKMETYYCIAAKKCGNRAMQKMRAWEYKLPSSYKQNPKHQGGGEPLDGCKEIRGENFCCFLQQATFEAAVKSVRIAVERGYDGIALDGIGYKNYYGCFCNTCCKARKRYFHDHPGMSEEEAVSRFNEEVLVKFYDRVIAYAKIVKPSIKTTCHVWPVFLPNILHGNQLPVDYCGQTVAWFYKPYWSLNKVERYTKVVVENQALRHSASVGAPFIAFFSKKDYRVEENRSAERVRQEIQIVKRAGAKAIQFAELGHILNAPEIAKVVSEELGGNWKSKDKK